MKGNLVGVSPTTLQLLITAAEGAILADFARGTSYSIAGRSFTFPNLEAAQDMISEANYALGIAQGTRSTNIRANFNGALGRGTSQS